MIKYIDVSPFDINGNPTTVEVRPGYGMQKIAKYETLMQDMRDFIANIKPREGKAFLLIAAMGDQNWGSNKNADFWPTEALSHEGHDYGYLTFEDNGHWYHQHNNKDPEKSYGKVIKSIYNPQMCRIELIVEVDLTKDDVIREKLANNEVIQVSMGCFEAGTEIWTQHCYGEPIETIKAGDIVYGHDGKEHVVNATSKRKYNGDVVKVSVTSRDPLSCTADHPFYVVQKDNLAPREQPSIEKASWIKAKDLKRGDYAVFPINQDVSEPDYVDKWYAKLAGYYLAEGYMAKAKSGKKTAIGLSCNDNDKCPQEIGEICSHIKDAPEPHIYKHDRMKKCLRITIYNEELAQHMIETCGEYAKHKYLSREVFYWSEENIKWLLGAYIDGDGCVVNGKWQKGSISISTSSKRLAFQIVNLMAKIGIIASVNCSLHQPSTIVKKCTIEWIIFVGKSYTDKLLGYSSKLDKGYVAPRNRINQNFIDDNYLYLKIKTVETKRRSINVYNLEVDGSDSYVANGLAVHNSTVSYDICKVCHPNWLAFYNVAEPDMVKLAKADSLDEVYEIGKRNGVDLSYITELNPDGGPVGIHSKVSKYCHHMKYARNRLLPTGERACVINLRPKFFDISWVNTNADKSAFVLDKVAAEIGEANEQELAKRLAENEKRAAEKRAIEDKKADIDKEIPGEVISDDADLIKEYYAKRLLPEIVPYEKEIPDTVIDQAAKKYSLGEILSTFMIMGMFPHPREFQRIVLVQTGDNENLRAMANPENVLTPAILNAIAGDTGRLPEMDFGIGHDNINGDLASLLQQFMPQRSYYRPHVAKRIIMIKKAEYKRVNAYIDPDTKPPKVIPALLAAIGGIYMAAKLTGDKGLNDLVTSAQKNRLPVLAGLAGAALLYEGARAHSREMGANARFNRFQDMERERREAERMQKMSSFGSSAASIGLPILGAYLWAGHSINKMQRGEDPGSIGTFVAKYPLVAGLAGAALVNPASRNAMASVFKRNKGAVEPVAEAAADTASKAAKNPGAWKKLLLPTASVAAPIVGTHAIAANTINKAQEGRPYNKTEAFITKHPLAIGALGAAAITPPVRNAIKSWGKYIVKGAEHKLYNLQELDPIEQDKLICAYWEYGDNEQNLS